MNTEEVKDRIWRPEVFEQYEYAGFLITISSWWFSNHKELIGLAVELKYSQIIDLDNYEDDMEETLEKNGYKVTYDDDNWETYVNGEPAIIYIDAHPEELSKFGFDTENSSSILQYLIDNINHQKGIERGRKKNGFIVLKEIKKYVAKSENKKPPRKARGFNNLAWATLVKLRDGKCTNCHSADDLHAHHIKSYKEFPELRYDVNNGITLCGICHREHHKLNGR